MLKQFGSLSGSQPAEVEGKISRAMPTVTGVDGRVQIISQIFTRRRSQNYRIPQEKELDQLIAGFNNRYSAYLQLLKETGFRPGEVLRLTSLNIDVEKRFITLSKPEKRSNNRQA